MVYVYIYIWYIYTFIYQWLYPMYIQCINIDRERWAMKICKAYEGICLAPADRYLEYDIHCL